MKAYMSKTQRTPCRGIMTRDEAAEEALWEAKHILDKVEQESEQDGAFYLGGRWPTGGAVTGEGKILADALTAALADWPEDHCDNPWEPYGPCPSTPPMRALVAYER